MRSRFPSGRGRAPDYVGAGLMVRRRGRSQLGQAQVPCYPDLYLVAGFIKIDLPLLLIRRLGRPIVATHSRSRRVEQRHRLAVILMRMFFDLVIAEVAGFILLVETFDT